MVFGVFFYFKNYFLEAEDMLREDLPKIITDTLPGPKAQAIIDVFSSFISDEISDFNSSVYYSNPDYLRCSYKEGILLG